MSGLDVALFHWINAAAVHPALDAAMPVVTNSRVWAALLLVASVVLVLRGGRRGRVTAVALAASLALSDASTSQVWKPLFGRERPCRSLPEARLLVRCGGRNGFPSNHAANAGAVTAAAAVLYPATLRVVPVLAVAVGYSRVYVGVHYPGDVAAGLAYGALLGLLVARLARRAWLPAGGRAKGRKDGETLRDPSG